MSPLDAFNNADAFSATAVLTNCCASRRWARAVAARRPFESLAALIDAARTAWSEVSDRDRLRAFAAHPLIGDVELLRKRYGDTGDRANAEQGQVLGADERVLRELAELNIDYRNRHGFIFIVYASGKSAEEMLDLLKERIHRSTDDEIATAAADQMKITELRLTELMNPTRVSA